MCTWTTTATILLAFVTLTTSQSLMIPKQVDRVKAGDVFQPNPGKKCTDIDNAEEHSLNANLCKCKGGSSTLYFDNDYVDSCFSQLDIWSEGKTFLVIISG